MQKILVVDDSEEIRFLLQTMLETQGYHVEQEEFGKTLRHGAQSFHAVRGSRDLVPLPFQGERDQAADVRVVFCYEYASQVPLR